MNQQFSGYEPYCGDLPRRTKGALISMENGASTPYSLDALQSRGIFFIKPGDSVYEGMIIGEHNRNNDLEVNPTKKKKQSNVRSSGTDDAVKIEPPKVMTLEEAMEWIHDDELMEITPESVRLRKKYLKAHERKKHK